MISKSTIDKIFDTARIEEVIGDFMQLKKAGSNFKGLSPFSDEKSPSFMVSPVKQIWKDFSSGKGGNVVSFVMEHEHFSYPEALRYLAKRYNIEIEETVQTDEQKAHASTRESLYLVSEFAKDYFANILHKDEEGKAIGYSYFKERGFTPEIIEKFGLGYSPEKWDALTNEALGKGYKLEFLEQVGLTITKGERHFDRFRARVIFPIFSMSGRVLGFGGRILTNDKKAAKYLNSPESDIYHKSKILYGIYQAKQEIAKQDMCYLVEGYTDVISLYQSGVKNVVASSGTALTTDQIRLINRLTPNITILYDGDAAGMRASFRGIDLILEEGMNVKVLTFEEGEDPDTFAKNNSSEYVKSYIEENAKDFIQFKASVLMDEVAGDPIKKGALIREMVASIAKIPSRIQQEVFVQECSKIMDISEGVLFNELAQINSKQRVENNRKLKNSKSGSSNSNSSSYNKYIPYPEDVPPSENAAMVHAEQKSNPLLELERKLLSILLIYGNEIVDFVDYVEVYDEEGDVSLEKEVYRNRIISEVYLQLQEDEIEFSNNLFRAIYHEAISSMDSEGIMKVDSLVQSANKEVADAVTTILMEDEKYHVHDWVRKDIFPKKKSDTVSQLVVETLLNLRRILIRSKINEIQQELLSNLEDSDRINCLEDAKDYMSLQLIITHKLNRVI